MGADMKATIVAGTVMLALMVSGCARVTEQSLRDKGLAPLTQQELEERFARPVKVRFDNLVGDRGTTSYMAPRLHGAHSCGH